MPVMSNELFRRIATDAITAGPAPGPAVPPVADPTGPAD